MSRKYWTGDILKKIQSNAEYINKNNIDVQMKEIVFDNKTIL